MTSRTRVCGNISDYEYQRFVTAFCGCGLFAYPESPAELPMIDVLNAIKNRLAFSGFGFSRMHAMLQKYFTAQELALEMRDVGGIEPREIIHGISRNA